MSRKIEEMLMTAIFEVFEKMFYIFTEPQRLRGDYQMKSAISFKGPVSGTMYILLSKGIGQTMAQNMLGLDEDEITEPVMADCVKESMNMICGNFIRKLDPERVFHLSIPTFHRLSGNERTEPDADDGNIRLMLAGDEGCIEVCLTASGLS